MPTTDHPGGRWHDSYKPLDSAADEQ